ncbi:hypothetical protein LZ31DRAFT_35959 [Colletotrichum somersetense]|nr:hypothetical protein LZ31DRAFT_35959 [Colletotrichum somersetense]
MKEASDSPESDPTTHLRPTHRVKKTTCGEYGAQLLISTRDHVYDAEDVETGKSAITCIGSWNDGSVGGLAQIIVEHRNDVRQRHAAEGQASPSFRGKGNTVGGFAHDPKPST